ncbi:MAG: two-component system phosphate regulon sensor histidine kinase PhoR [Sphingobacteriales bacterium]|jgi:two-component system phosphate regulon sensor histidine kinase PhoR
MKTTSPNKLILITALASGAVSSLLALLFYSYSTNYGVGTVVLSSLLSTLIFAIAFKISIKKFILKRVQQLFRAFPSMSSTRIKPKDMVNMNEDVLEKVSLEMEKWSMKQRREMVKLQKTVDFRREFIGNLAHELKTPIFNIQGYILTLLEGALEDPEINRKFLLRAGKSVDRMIQLISELDNITKLESGKANLNIRRFDLLILVRDVLDLQENSASEKGIRLKLKTFSNTPLWVKADSSKISQVLTNLVSNSIHYGAENGVTSIDFEDLGEKWLVHVKDNGVGISEEDVPRVFERFYRVDKSRNRNTGGSGLGLAISKHIIEAHSGTIKVKSTKEKGSTFSFSLPK